MTDRLYEGLPEHFVRQMRNWARARSGLLAPMRSCMVLWLLAGGDSYDTSPPPILSGEAADVDEALDRVPVRYRQAVMEFWLHEGRPIRAHARKRGIDKNTFAIWVERGNDALRRELLLRRSVLSMVSEANSCVMHEQR